MLLCQEGQSHVHACTHTGEPQSPRSPGAKLPKLACCLQNPKHTSSGTEMHALCNGVEVWWLTSNVTKLWKH
jgi:hypothetical protein